MSDNKTPHLAEVYDRQVERTIPGYSNFHDQIIDFITAWNQSPGLWLDTGCGTGTLAAKGLAVFRETSFLLADPSPEMLGVAREKLAGREGVRFLDPAGTQDLDLPGESVDVVTAVMAHHYLDVDGRRRALENCFRMLKRGGLLITFENIRPNSATGTGIGLERWKRFQTRQGKSEAEAQKHLERFGTEFFPLTVGEHLKLLTDTGFGISEIIWVSYMQAGFYAIK